MWFDFSEETHFDLSRKRQLIDSNSRQLSFNKNENFDFISVFRRQVGIKCAEYILSNVIATNNDMIKKKEREIIKIISSEYSRKCNN